MVIHSGFFYYWSKVLFGFSGTKIQIFNANLHKLHFAEVTIYMKIKIYGLFTYIFFYIFQAHNSYLRDQWLHSILWKVCKIHCHCILLVNDFPLESYMSSCWCTHWHPTNNLLKVNGTVYLMLKTSCGIHEYLNFLCYFTFYVYYYQTKFSNYQHFSKFIKMFRKHFGLLLVILDKVISGIRFFGYVAKGKV